MRILRPSRGRRGGRRGCLRGRGHLGDGPVHRVDGVDGVHGVRRGRVDAVDPVDPVDAVDMWERRRRGVVVHQRVAVHDEAGVGRAVGGLAAQVYTATIRIAAGPGARVLRVGAGTPVKSIFPTSISSNCGF